VNSTCNSLNKNRIYFRCLSNSILKTYILNDPPFFHESGCFEKIELSTLAMKRNFHSSSAVSLKIFLMYHSQHLKVLGRFWFIYGTIVMTRYRHIQELA